MNDFWPTGWLVWLSVLLGTFDVSCITFLITRFAR